jgi:hypothetical protein
MNMRRHVRVQLHGIDAAERSQSLFGTVSWRSVRFHGRGHNLLADVELIDKAIEQLYRDCRRGFHTQANGPRGPLGHPGGIPLR